MYTCMYVCMCVIYLFMYVNVCQHVLTLIVYVYIQYVYFLWCMVVLVLKVYISMYVCMRVLYICMYEVRLYEQVPGLTSLSCSSKSDLALMVPPGRQCQYSSGTIDSTPNAYRSQKPTPCEQQMHVCMYVQYLYFTYYLRHIPQGVIINVYMYYIYDML